jgi:hypothetical protein
MERFFAVLVAILMLAGVARAGVVVDEQQVSDRGAGTPITHKITVMVQGNKQKSIIDDGKQTLITNLDQGTRMMVNDARKMYVEMPFPPQNMPKPTSANTSGLTFKKTGSTQTLAGYSCDDYSGTGTMGGNEITVNGCFSMSAPGAADFTGFQKAMTEKVKGTPMALMSDAPPGVPLKIDTTMKVTHMMMPGMSPQQAEEMNKRLAARPPIVTHMTVSKVTAQELAADTFQPPKGYTKQQMPMMGPGMAMGQRPLASAPPVVAGATSTPAPAPNKSPQ